MILYNDIIIIIYYNYYYIIIYNNNIYISISIESVWWLIFGGRGFELEYSNIYIYINIVYIYNII